SLACERVRDQFGLDWAGFNQALAGTPPGNHGGILLPWFEAEIVPRVNQPGIHRFDLNEQEAAANPEVLRDPDACRDCRAIVEAQMMSMRLHSQWMKVEPKSIYATGGASTNTAILQVMADVMNCPVRRIEVAKSTVLGAALRAAHGWLLHTGGKPDWAEVVAGLTDPVPHSEIQPNPKAASVYDKLIEKYARCEREVLRELAR
ncbi:MAG: FGGY-family carbohydrate kinase, partial [Verrucomicrobiia bacterium]